VVLRCLIVDDNRPFLDAASDVLSREGVAVVGVAATSAEALALADRLRPDVVLVDINLGDENGLDLARRLVPPVILISTYTEGDVGELAASSPAVGFLSKSLLSGRAIADLLAPGKPSILE
jgi:two-component system nitrate/nitrite response regulator NarL